MLGVHELGFILLGPPLFLTRAWYVILPMVVLTGLVLE
jgi:hypothetical protein